MKIKNTILITLLFMARLALPQGFVNLDFESAVIRTNGLAPPSINETNALPGWSAYISGNGISSIFYNTVPLDAATVTLQGTNTSVSSLKPIQGNFTVVLFGASAFAPQQSAAIGQTGQIPINALSLIFWGNVGPSDVSFNSQILTLLLLGSTANYNIYGADVSALAGQTGQLLFTAQPGSADIIDNIQFSTTPVPEPGTLALASLGGALCGCFFWKRLKPKP